MLTGGDTGMRNLAGDRGISCEVGSFFLSHKRGKAHCLRHKEASTVSYQFTLLLVTAGRM
jgi:hypothetical protein